MLLYFRWCVEPKYQIFVVTLFFSKDVTSRVNITCRHSFESYIANYVLVMKLQLYLFWWCIICTRFYGVNEEFIFLIQLLKWGDIEFTLDVIIYVWYINTWFVNEYLDLMYSCCDYHLYGVANKPCETHVSWNDYCPNYL